MPGPQSQAAAGPGSADRRRDLAAALRPLLLDIGIPIGTYYLLRNAFGVSVWLSLALSSIGPAVRATAGLVAERKLNLLALLMLAVTLAGIAVSFLTGDPRAMIAKDSIVGSVGPAVRGVAPVPPARAAVQHHLGPGAAGRLRRPPGRRVHAGGHHDGVAGHGDDAERDRRGNRGRRR